MLNDRNHFRDKMDIEIKLMFESIKVSKHELQLGEDWRRKLKSEKMEIDRIINQNKVKNEREINSLTKIEDLAKKLKKESDALRANLMIKEPGFTNDELLSKK